MRVLLLSWEYPPAVVGGLGRHVQALATELAAAGHEVAVATRHLPGSAYDEMVDGVRVVRAPEDPATVPFNDLLAWTMAFEHSLSRAALRVALQMRPDVVHAHDWLVAHTAATVKEVCGLPLVATMHATEAGRHQGWLPGPLNRSIHSTEWWLTWEARRVITCSAHMRWEVTRLFDLPAASVDVIPNGTDLGAFRPRPMAIRAARARWAGSGPLVVLPGRLEWEKGAQVLLSALPRLRRRHPGLRVVLAGSGTQEQALRERAARLRLGGALVLAGRLGTADLAALLAAADVAVAPSLYEPFGLVALEAAAAGVPLVVSDSGGLRELVAHGDTGLRVAPGDPAALADGITRMLGDEVAARRMARAARAAAAEHTWAEVAARTAGVYQRAIQEETALRASLLAGSVPPVVIREGNLLADDG